MKVNIYALIDPISLKVRYIGRTKCELKKRLAEHISKSKLDYNNTHKSNWIKSLLKINSKPFIRLLCIIEGWKESHKVERGLINKYKERLLNHEDRGEGLVNHIVTEKQKKSISETLKAKYASGEIVNPAGKSVYVYNLDGSLYKHFNSGREAENELGIGLKTISKCTRGILKQYSGYQFSRECNENMPVIKRKPKVNKNLNNKLWGVLY